jgi:hypothetical protein
MVDVYSLLRGLLVVLLDYHEETKDALYGGVVGWETCCEELFED